MKTTSQLFINMISPQLFVFVNGSFISSGKEPETIRDCEGIGLHTQITQNKMHAYQSQLVYTNKWCGTTFIWIWSGLMIPTSNPHHI